MSEASQAQRRTVRFHGRVQGVGFRYTTRQIAASRAVTGYVQNMMDGSVLLVAEGSPNELDAFVTQIDAALGGYIESAQTETARSTGEFSGFEIRH